MIFDPSISGLEYAPNEEAEQVDNYPKEDEDMDRYYEEKEASNLTESTKTN